MGCSSCKGKGKGNSGKRKAPAPAPPKKRRPAPTQPSPKPSTPKGWRGGDPFKNEVEVTSEDIDAYVSEESLPDNYLDSHQIDNKNHEDEVDDSDGMVWLHTPEDDCDDCDESYEEFTSALNRIRSDMAKPHLQKLEQEKNNKVKDIKLLNQRIDAIKFYLNGIDVEGTDISDITLPIESTIQSFLSDLEETSHK